MTTPPAPRRRTPSTDVSGALLAAAEKVLASEGYVGLTIRAVAGEAGVAPMGVYNRFRSKAGLVEALYARGFELLGDAITSPAGVGVVRLRRAGLAYRAFALGHAHLYALMFAKPDDFQPSQESVAVARQCFSELVTMVADSIARGGLVAADPLEAAQGIWAAVHGAVSIELAGMGFTPDAQATYEALVDAVLAGLAAS